MTKELKIAIAMLVLGALFLGMYWFYPAEKQSTRTTIKPYKQSEERILLPKYEKSIYQNIPEVQSYLADVKQLISEGNAVLPLARNELDTKGQIAQSLVLKNEAFLKDTKQGTTLYHNDMMRILPALVSSLDSKTEVLCKQSECYQAEKYNFVTNTTTRAIVDVTDKKVLSVESYPNMQADISLRLTRIAQAIALNAPEVKKELGFTPSKKDITMANVRGTMKESPCENTTHLCVAPTFTDHHKAEALWAVVDLTELKLAAAKWAGLGKTTTPACVSERTLQNRYIMENFCQKNTVLHKNGWQITYRLTGSDGLEIRDVSYKNKPVLTSAKIVDWHVSYQQKGAASLDDATETYIEGRRVEFVRGEGDDYLFGYNDAMGCPMFSTSVVLPFNAPQVKPLKSHSGFMLTQDYRNPKWPMACNYRYENRFEFYDDGAFRVVGVNKGRGCGDHAIYRPVMRIDMAVDNKEQFYSYSEDTWQLWEKENVDLVDYFSKKKQYPYKIVSASNTHKGYYIEPNYGQFNDNAKADNATLFVTRFHENEGDKDLLTLGSCCDLKSEGVERYMEEPESIDGSNLVLWYVPRIRNNTQKGQEYCWADTRIDAHGNLAVQVWPCTVGPKFIPMKD